MRLESNEPVVHFPVKISRSVVIATPEARPEFVPNAFTFKLQMWKVPEGPYAKREAVSYVFQGTETLESGASVADEGRGNSRRSRHGMIHPE